MSTGSPSVSVVIPTYDRPAALELTLASLVGQRHREFEVVIQDDGSPESTAAVIARYASRLAIRAERLPNQGRATARNAAIRRATGELLILVDDDRIASPDFVGEHVRAFLEGGPRQVNAGWQYGVLARWHHGIDISVERLLEILGRRPELAPRLRPDAGVIELVDAELVSHDLERAIGPLATSDPWWEGSVEPLLHHFGLDLAGFAFPWHLSATANMSLARELALEVGLFDGDFRGWGLEDAEFLYRLHRAGARLLVTEGAANFHQFHRRGAHLWSQWPRNAAHFLARHPEPEIVLFLAAMVCRIEFAEASRLALAAADPDRRAGVELVAQLLRAELGFVLRPVPAAPNMQWPAGPRRRAWS